MRKRNSLFFFPMRPTLLCSSNTQLCILTSTKKKKKKALWFIFRGDLNKLIIIFTRALHSSVHGNLMRMHMTHNQLRCLKKCLADLWSEFNKHWSSWSVLVSYVCVITQEQGLDTDFSGEEQEQLMNFRISKCSFFTSYEVFSLWWNLTWDYLLHGIT